MTIVDSTLKPKDYYSCYAVIVEGGGKVRVESSKFVSGGYWNVYALNIYASGVSIVGTTFYYCMGGVYIKDASNVSILDCVSRLSFSYHIRIVNSFNVTLNSSEIICREVSGGCIITIYVRGLVISGSSSITVSGCVFKYCTTAIDIENSDDIMIYGVTIEHSDGSAVYLEGSSFVCVESSTLMYNVYGVRIFDSGNITLLDLELYDDGVWIYDVDEVQLGSILLCNVSNNGRPIVMFINETNLNISERYGEVLLFYCVNVSVYVDVFGLEAYSSRCISLVGVEIRDNDFGLLLLDSEEVSISDSAILSTYYGVYSDNLRCLYAENITINSTYVIYAMSTENVYVNGAVLCGDYGITFRKAENLDLRFLSFNKWINLEMVNYSLILNSSLSGITLENSIFFNVSGNNLDMKKKASNVLDIYSCFNGMLMNNVMCRGHYGVKIQCCENITMVRNNVSQNNYGIYVEQSGNIWVTGNIIQENEEGINIVAVDNTVLRDNRLINDLLKIFDTQYDSIEIANNTVNGFPVVVIYDMIGVDLVNEDLGEVLICDSDSIHIEGVSLGGLFVDNSSGVEVAYTYISHCDFGVYIINSSDLRFDFVDVDCADGVGVYIKASCNVSIYNSTIVRNGRDGLYVDSNCQNISIRYSNILSNREYGVYAYESNVSAILNFWGDPDGPVRTFYPDGYDPEEIYSIGGKITVNPYLSDFPDAFDGTPPIISNVEWHPHQPMEGKSVFVYAEIQDNLAVSEVYLYYRVNHSEWVKINMTWIALDLYQAEIPGQSGGSIVYFYIMAVDIYGKIGRSNVYNYTVAKYVDTTPPMILDIKINPSRPLENQTIKITVNVTDDMGISNVYLLYRIDGSSWSNVSMVEQNGVYTAKIPGQPRGTTIYLYIVAIDLAGNSAESDIMTLKVPNDTSPPIIHSVETTIPIENESIIVTAEVTDNIGIRRVYLYYRINNGDWVRVEMKKQYTEYMAVIPAQSAGTKIEIYVEAIDLYGNRATSEIIVINVEKQSTKTSFISQQIFPILATVLAIIISTISLIIMLRKRKSKTAFSS